MWEQMIVLLPYLIGASLCPVAPGEASMNGGTVRFSEAFDLTVKTWEGGDQLHEVPGDPGGLTRWGVAQRFHPDVDVRHMTEEQARNFYHENFWRAVQAPRMPPAVRWDVFDYAVNRHPDTSIRTLQHAISLCNMARGRMPISVDGRVGPQTLGHLQQLPAERVVRVFRALRSRYYVTRVENKPSQAKFLEGWLDRVDGKRGNV